MSFRLGDIAIDNKVLCAPICGATKVPYRQLARRYGADLCYTEMIKAAALVRKTRRSFELARIGEREAPVGAQICGGDPAEMAEAAGMLEVLGFHTIDINMGCPVPKVVREGAGAALMREPEQVQRVVKAVADAVAVPVTIKIRTGWTREEGNAVEVSKAAEQGGAKMVSIHGRARSHRHKGSIDYATIRAVKEAVGVPVVGNGGIFAVEDAAVMVAETGCDAVMIGRGGYGRPWFFRDCCRVLRGEEPLGEPGAAELGETLRHHFDVTIAILGEDFGTRTFRKIASWYFGGKPFGTYFRDLVFRSKTRAELSTIIEAWGAHAIACEEALSAGEAPRAPAIIAELSAGPRPAWLERPARQQERCQEQASPGRS